MWGGIRGQHTRRSNAPWESSNVIHPLHVEEPRPRPPEDPAPGLPVVDPREDHWDHIDPSDLFTSVAAEPPPAGWAAWTPSDEELDVGRRRVVEKRRCSGDLAAVDEVV